MDATTFTKKLSVIHAQRLLLDQKEARLLEEFKRTNKKPINNKNIESEAKAKSYIARRFYINQPEITDETLKSK